MTKKRHTPKMRYRHFRDASASDKEKVKKLSYKTHTKKWHSYNMRHVTDSQRVLLSSLFYKFGGNVRVAKILGVSTSRVANWLNLGVPGARLEEVVVKLKVSKWGLNYKYFAKNKHLFPDLPEWGDVIEEYGFEEDVVKRLRKLGEPK